MNRQVFKNIESNKKEASNLLLAMSNEKRLQMLCALSNKELSVANLAKKIDLCQSAVSQHLSRLRALKLVSTRRDAQTVYYSVSSPMIAPVLLTLENVFSHDRKKK